ncbi:histidine phosphatase family protein [Yoonia sediminilitoris]|uniref:Broad specificity phosphatase PhoE n=1 Tax=Yoonia sediminilitoris TaxID=1286148 RepID=A0A2T6KPS6_9RHOB|nr:histidine phosphatase family protein [Yoonia sediminilitoris]PUB18564.1 broad specificity phosphatase PhoE [Yoonia sediminilitoris]RCW98732.1 broad specificity phosphatase PhoE [Yoonia sediminilitoris]
MTRFWLVRHGPTHQKTFVGWRDVPADLSDQALIDRVDAYLPSDALVIASDLRRASATADAIGGTRQRLPDNAGLREFDFGVWDGMTFDQVAARDPDLSRRFWEQPGELTAPEGESWNGVAARVSRVVDQLCRDHADADIVLVAHIGVIMTQIQRASSSTAYQAMGHNIDNLSVTDITMASGRWQVGNINHIP